MPVLLEAPAGDDLGAVVDGARADALRGDALHLLRL
jgi:hypothetical protein